MAVSHSSRSSAPVASVAEARTALLKRVARAAMDYLEKEDSRPVAPTPKAVAALSVFSGPLPPGPTNAEAVLHLLDTYGSPATVAKTAGRFFGFVNGGCLPAALAASWLVSTWDQKAGFLVQCPPAITLEEIALEGGGRCWGCPMEPAAQ